MKKLIRKGVFETNSSSSHSIAIASEDKQFVLDTIYPDQHGTIIIRGDEFGWEWFKHNDAGTKAAYAAQQFAYDNNALETLEYVIKEQTGAERVIFEGLDDGYIDHDSHGILGKSAYELKNFIFNKNSWLFGGNDNSTASPDFYDVPEFRDGRMVMPEYKYELSIEGLKDSVKFVDYPDTERIEESIASLMDGALVTHNGSFIKDESLMWQITRARGEYYELGYHVDQDYSTGNIRLTLEGERHSFDIRQKLKEDGMFIDVDWKGQSKMVTEEMLKVPGLVKLLSFTVKEL
jgi:hypothetical protein